MKIENILATKGAQVLTVTADQPLRAVVSLLVQHNIGALVVVGPQGRPVGIISERDVVRAAARQAGFLDLPVEAVMTRAVVVGAPGDDVATVLHTMTQRRFRHVPIVEGGQLVGIISIGDLVKAQLDRYLGEADTLETQIIEE